MKQDAFKGFEPEPKPEKNGKKEKVVQEWEVPSWTNPTMRYKVRREGSHWTCTCYFFVEKIVKLGLKKTCKHVDSVKESLGLLKEDLSGYKSAIQKAIRRGNLPLLKLSFAKLMEVEPKWVTWRIVVLAAEESWPYVGIAGRFSFGEESTRENLWKLLVNMSLHPKNKEAEGLNILADKVVRHNEDPKALIKDPGRMAIFNGWMSIRQSIGLLETEPETFWGWFSTGENEFAQEIVATAKRRSKFGEMSGDKMLLFVAAYLACVTKVEPIELEEVPREEEVEAEFEIPLYAWDMHSSKGKIVYYQIRKLFQDESMGEYVAMECWFNIGSAQCNEMVEDSYWWNLCLEAWARRRGKTLEECRRDFKHWWPKIEERISKILHASKRSI